MLIDIFLQSGTVDKRHCALTVFTGIYIANNQLVETIIDYFYRGITTGGDDPPVTGTDYLPREHHFATAGDDIFNHYRAATRIPVAVDWYFDIAPSTGVRKANAGNRLTFNIG